MNLQEARATLPHLEGLDDDQVVDAIHMAYYADLPREQVANQLGVTPKEPPAPPRTFWGTVADTGLSAVKGAIGVPEAVVGLADIATGGRAGKALEEVGFRPGEAKKMLDEAYSPAQKAANEQVQKAEGLWNTFKAAVSNPSTIGHSIVESLPLMGAGGLAGRGMVAAAGGRIGAGTAGALGEGIASAGSAAEQIRQETKDGLLTGDQPRLAVATGAATSLFGMLGARVAKSLGIADVDTMLAGAAVNPKVAKGITRQVLEGAVSEGLLEELPQSVMEQVLQNIALDRPLDYQVSQAAVLGTLSGAAMGGGANLAGALRKPAEPEKKPRDIIAAPDVDTAIDAFQKSVKMPEMPGGVPAAQVGDATARMEKSLTGTDPAALLGVPSLGGADTNASMITAARSNLEDRRADDYIAGMREDANRELQSVRERPVRQLPHMDAIIEPGDRIGPAGAPLSEVAANKTASAIGGITIPVQGGWIVRPRTKPGAPDEANPDALGGSKSADQPAVSTATAGQSAGAPVAVAPGGMPAGTGVAPRGGDAGLDVAPTGLADQGGRGASASDADPQVGQGETAGLRALGGLDGRSDANGDAAAEVDGWKRFPPEMRSLDVPRADMPQIKAEHRGAMVNFLNARGIEHSEELDVSPGTLRPTQAEYSPAKIEQARAFTGGNRAILVSADNRILDGHHQWAQALQDDKPIRIIRLKAPITQLLNTVKEFPSATTDDSSAAAASPSPAPAPDVGPGAAAADAADGRAGEIGPSGGPVAADAEGTPSADVAPPAAGQGSDVGARWDRMTPGERRVLLTQNTKAKGKAIDRVSAQPWDALEPGWQKTVARVMPKADAAPAAEEPVGPKAPLPVPEEAFVELMNESVGEDEDPYDDLFKPADKMVDTDKATTGVMTPEEAKKRLDEWKAHAMAQGEDSANSEKTVLSLFDASGVWSQPWRDAGYNVITFDIQNGQDINDFSAQYLIEELDIQNVYAILAAPPCTDFSSSGAHAWSKKDADGRTEASIELVRQTLRTISLFRPSIWALENPVGRIAKLTGLPNPTLAFQPHNYGDPYTKRTMLWGSFETDLPQANVEPTEGSKITKLSGYDKFGRSLTPEGFAYAFFMANNAQDLGVAKTIAREFRGVDEKLVQQALDAGMSERDVFDLVADDGNDRAIDSANKVLRDAIKERKPKATSAPAPTATPAPSAATKTKPKPEPKRTSDAREAEAARAAYFTPGNIVRSYYGFDEVLEYRAPTQEGGEWSVKVHEVQELDGKWVRVGKPQDARVHSTQPSADQLSDGPHAKVSPAAGPDVPYTSPRADGQPFTNAPARGVEKARKAGARAEGQNDELDAEMQGYEDRAGIEGWWGVGGARGQKDALLAPGRVQALQAIGVSNQRAGYGKDGDLTKVLWNYLPDDIKEKLVALRKAGWTPKEADAPAAPTPTAAPKPDPLTEQEKAAKAKMLGAAAKLAQLLSKNTRMNITPEQEQAMLPIVIELFEGAMDLGYVKFKQAARYVRKFIADAIDQDAADAIPLDTLQGAYIATARRHQDKAITPKGEVVMTEMADVLADEEESTTTTPAAPPANNGGQNGTARNMDRPSEGAPGGEPSADVPAADGKRGSGRVPDQGSRDDQQGAPDSAVPGAGVSAGMGAGTSAPVPGGRARRGAKPAGDGGVPRPPRADAGPGLFDDARREGADDGLTSPTLEPAQPPQFKPQDFTIEDDFELGEGGKKQKFRDTIAAVRLAKELMEQEATLGGGRVVTPEEQQVLAKYAGWGAVWEAFDAAKPDWQREFVELKSLLTEEEYAAAKRSTRYAHYTSRQVVQDGIYAALRRFGFTGGRVLEPGAGVGNFIGLMPQDMRSAGRVTAVEREPMAATIARALYPMQNIQLADFTDFKGNDGYFDAVVGNPPFADDSQTDSSGRKHLTGLTLHNYFFAKSVDMLREGGILAQVVTSGFLDAQGDRARKYIGDRTKFLGAIRLPNNAFSKNAGTKVTTDIIFLQKRPESEWGSKAARAEAAVWMAAPNWTSATGEKLPLNQYFHDHPEMMLGEFGPYGTMYRPGVSAVVARPGQDTAALLREAIARLPESVYKSAAEMGAADMVDAAVIALRNPPVQEGGFFIEDGKLIQRLTDMAGEPRGVEITAETKWTAKTSLGADGFDKLRRLAEMRSTLRSLLAAEFAGSEEMTVLRQKLNEQYDEFVKKHHLLNDRGTYRVFDDDPDFPLLLSLEMDYTPGIGAAEAKKMGLKPTKSSAKKSAIFRQSVVNSRTKVQRVDKPEDAIAVSMAERGRLDTAYIAELLGRPAQEVLQEMISGDSPLLFLDPATDEYTLRDVYLSGNVRKKLAQAKAAGMAGNVSALERVQPEDVPAHEIGAKIGAPWVPTSVYEDFAKELFGEGTEASIQYQKMNSSYATYIKVGSEVNNSNKWGIPKYTGEQLLAAMLNNRTIKVEYRDKEGTHLDKEATEMANVKAQEIRDRFNDWLFSDPDRSEVLVRAYNDTNNNYVVRNYDGSWMTFPGKVPDSIIKFRRHQRNAIARIVQDRTTLLDHVVGAGKTFTVVSAAMELRRTGLAKKPMVTVPNHLVKQWAADFYRLYPGARVLTASKKDFQRENRRRFLAKIATGDWDAVVIAHSSFGFIRPGAEFEAKFNDKQVALLKEALEEVQDGDGNESAKKRTVKQLEGMIERLENRIKSLRDKAMDDLLDFDQLGVDQLFVDEAHLFKNLLYTTKLQGVAGLGDPAGAKRAYDMYVKTQEVMEKNGRGQGVVFATGTPVSNSLAEKYHMMRYLMPQQMEELGFQSFDAWANTYAEVTQVWMQKTSGDGFKAQNRMSTFVNVHELLRLFDQVADTVTNQDIKQAYREENNGEEYPLPPVKTGRRIPVSIEQTPAQREYMADLVKRAKVLEDKKGPPKKGEDNHLSLMTDARKAAMDIRLVDVDRIEREPGGRVDAAATNIFERYQQYAKHKGTQLVFSDLGTPVKHAQTELKEYNALRGIIAEASEEVRDRAALGDERAQDIVDAAEDAERELEEKGADWLTAVKAAERGFSVYDDLKKALMERGIPENEIAFIHDYNTDEQKAALFRKVNAGDIRVLMGSTQKMGAGTNVQQRLVALHHLDVPWRPSDVEQREGRIERQGNLLFQNKDDPSTVIPGFEVEILAYVTKDTLDMRMWQIQEVKLKVINQLRTRQIERNMDNAFEDAEMSASEMQAAATGNMDLLREIQARNDIKKLEQKRRSYEAQKNDLISRRRRNERELRELPGEIEEARRKQAFSIQYIESGKRRRENFKATIDGKEYTDVKVAGDYLQKLYDDKMFVRTVEKDGKKLREERTVAEMEKMQSRLKELERNGGRAKTLPPAEQQEYESLFQEAQDFQERAAPLDVTIDGQNFTARAKMVEFWRNITGDADGFTWAFNGKEYIRRTLAVPAASGTVAEAIADQKQASLGGFGPFTLTIEGQPIKGRREDKRIGVEAVLSAEGKAVAENLFELPADVTGETAAERVLGWAHARAESLGSDVSWLEADLRNAKKTQVELAKTDEMGGWPDEAKLTEARARHQEILARLKKSGAKTDDDQSGGPAFNQDGADTLTSTDRRRVGQMQQIVDTITGEWARSPIVTVVRSIASPAVPQAIRDEATRRLARGGRTPRGVIYQGKVWLFADAIGSDRQAAEVLFHEVLGHYGMRGHFGAEFDAHLEKVQMLRRPDVDAFLKRTGLNDTPENRRKAAEEVLAHLAQTKPELSLVQRALAIIRNWLRENLPTLFGDISLSDADLIEKFILPARRYVEGPGGPGGGLDVEPAFASQEPPFYSALQRGVQGVAAKAQPTAGWAGAIKALVNKGAVKADEVEWSGVMEWLGMQQGKVTKQEVLDYLDGNGVRVEEVVKGGMDTADLDAYEQNDGSWNIKRISDRSFVTNVRGFADDPEGAIAEAARRMAGSEGTKYGEYQLPGGTNYREVLLTLPEKEPDFSVDDFIDRMKKKYGLDALFNIDGQFRTIKPEFPSMLSPEDQAAYRSILAARKPDVPAYRTRHWDQPNVLAHIRLNDRIDASGARVMLIEEIQSDFAQDYRKQKEAIKKAVDDDFAGIIDRMKKAGVLEVRCD